MELSEYTRRKQTISDLQRKHDEATGALQPLLQQLKSKFGVESIEEGRKLLKKLEKKTENAERLSNQAWQEFESKWGEGFES